MMKTKMMNNKKEILDTILSKTDTHIDNIINIYQYGSRVYGNYNNSSDYDFIVIVSDKTNNQFSDRLININYFTPEEHQNRLDEHEISALECHFAPDEFIIHETMRFRFDLDLNSLRHSLSAKSSNSFVKAKKKLTIEKDYDLNIGRKSLWHSFRIIDFGIQICEKGTIDYSSMNELFKEIMMSYTWSDLFENYKQDYNKIVSRFRILAPKEINK